jgi:hypothetical protein
MRMSALMIEAAARHHALHGFDEVQVFQGKICWKEDAKLAGLSDADLARSAVLSTTRPPLRKWQ